MHRILRQKRPRLSKKALKARKEEQEASFYALVESEAIFEYVGEEAFKDYLSSIRSKSVMVQAALKVNGNDKVAFRFFCPINFFCAIVSQLTFDRSSDIKFTYVFYILNIQFSTFIIIIIIIVIDV